MNAAECLLSAGADAAVALECGDARIASESCATPCGARRKSGATVASSRGRGS